MAAKFKVGDRVKILDGEHIPNYVPRWVPTMKRFVGKETKIFAVNRVIPDKYEYELSCAPGYIFDERGLELAEDNKDEVLRKIHELFSLCIKIQQGGKGVDGYPFVDFDCSNYGIGLQIAIDDNGFGEDSYKGSYYFNLDKINEHTYNNCKAHLEELIGRKSGCITTNAPAVEHI